MVLPSFPYFQSLMYFFLFLSIEKEDINLIWVVKKKITMAIKEVARSNWLLLPLTVYTLHQKTIQFEKFTKNNKQNPHNKFPKGAGGGKERWEGVVV